MGFPTVIIGAGSAGAVIAARLTEDSTREVILVEAGPDYSTPERLPGDLADGRKNSMVNHDWGFRHRPTRQQRFSFRFPRGRVVGGSSAVNTCIALRGQPYDFEEWADRGLTEWSWEKCLPAFIRLENDLDCRAPWHGQSGPLPIRRYRPNEWVPWQGAFVEACRELGFPECYDTNEPGSFGVGPHAMNKVDERRMSVSETYLTKDVRDRANLTLQANTLVRRLIFRQRKVMGVELERADGKVSTIDTRDVVLAGGAVANPGILLRSGVGPKEDVERLGQRLIADVPGVGRQLLDHPGVAIFFRPRWGASTSVEHPLIQTALRCGSDSTGPVNDLLLQPGSCVPTAKRTWPLMSIMCQVGKARGVGSLRYESAEPLANPVIESALLEDPRDREMAVKGIELAYALGQTKPMQELGTFFWPGRKRLRKEPVADWVRLFCDSGYHPCGTIPMGTERDLDAGADQYGRLRGVEGVTVADASLMPTVPSANINLTVIMMAERIAEWV